ncbi:MAG: hypothetical protein QOJ89_1967 [bacterium]
MNAARSSSVTTDVLNDRGRCARSAQSGEPAEAVSGREHAPPFAGGTDLVLLVEDDEEAVVLPDPHFDRRVGATMVTVAVFVVRRFPRPTATVTFAFRRLRCRSASSPFLVSWKRTAVRRFASTE